MPNVRHVQVHDKQKQFETILQLLLDWKWAIKRLLKGYYGYSG